MLSELKRRWSAGWCKFYSVFDVLKGLDEDRSCLFDSTVIKAMTYGSEVWTPTKAEENLFAVTERAMERRMLKVSLCEHINNDTLRQMSGVKDIGVATRENKLRWAGHVARLRDDRWSSIIKNWLPSRKKLSGWSATIAVDRIHG